VAIYMTGARKYNVPTDKKNEGTFSAEFYLPRSNRYRGCCGYSRRRETAVLAA